MPRIYTSKYASEEERRQACNERARMRRKLNPKRDNEVWQKWSRSIKGRVQALMSGARSRATARGLPYDLDAEFIYSLLEPGVCSVTGLSFDYSRSDSSSINPFTPSLDRIVPALGYVKTNVRAVCFAVNAAKQDWSDDVLLAVASALVNHSTRNVT